MERFTREKCDAQKLAIDRYKTLGSYKLTAKLMAELEDGPLNPLTGAKASASFHECLVQRQDL